MFSYQFCSTFIARINYPVISELGDFDTGSLHGGYTNVLAWKIAE